MVLTFTASQRYRICANQSEKSSVSFASSPSLLLFKQEMPNRKKLSYYLTRPITGYYCLIYHIWEQKHSENMDLENILKQEPLRMLFYKILNFFFYYERIHNNKKHNSKRQPRVCHSSLSTKSPNSLQQQKQQFPTQRKNPESSSTLNMLSHLLQAHKEAQGH